MPMIGRGSAHRLEEGAPIAVCGEIAAPGFRILAGNLTEMRYVGGEAIELRIDDWIRTVRSDDPPLPAACTDLDVLRQEIERGLGGCQDLDVESLEQSARPELRFRETVVDGVEDAVCRFGGQSLADAEDLLERVVEPDSRRSAAEQVIVCSEASPDLARIWLHSATITPRDRQVLQPQSLTVEHAEDVMIRRDEQSGRIAERLVVCEPLRVGMAMGADDGQVLDRRVQRTGKA